tara:strand:- start:19565 stop:21208 length:1644 start_codon:yes stop_codon:yes gene_type:complete
MNRITKDELKRYTENYIDLKSDEYFIAPQVYSPLYHQLYEALIKNEEPLLPNNFDISSHQADLKECNTSFDRYLVATFDSRFELSHPLTLSPEEATTEKLLEYLSSKYGKTSTEIVSFNYDREKKRLLQLFPESLRSRFEKEFETGCRSSWYKLFTLNYKLSKLNVQWKQLVLRANQEDGANTLLDNVVRFNDIDNQKSRDNSSLFMTLFYELDQGRPDGNSNFSRLVLMLPTALELLEKTIQRQVLDDWNNNLDSEEVEANIAEALEYAKRKCSSEMAPSYSKYSDINHEFYDTLMTVILKNDYHNKILAKLSFEQSLLSDSEWPQAINLIFRKARWVSNKINIGRQINLVAQDLNINPSLIDADILEISEMVSRLLRNRLKGINDHTIENISLFIVTAIKFKLPVRIKGSLKGAKDQYYHLFNRLSESVHKAQKKELEPWKLETVFRPSLIHFLQYFSELILWSVNGTVKDLTKFIKLREIIYNSTLNISNNLEPTHHYLVLNICNYILSERIGINTVDYHFWEGRDPSDKLLQEHLSRTTKKWP